MKYAVQILNPDKEVIALPDNTGIRTPCEYFDTREEAETHRLELLNEISK